MTVAGLVAICYFAVAGGPEGTETLVRTAGPLYSVIGFIVMGLLWSVPMALMSAELTTCFPENGGYVLWVGAAFGPQMGEMAGWLQFVSSAVDLCLYPGLFVVYMEQMVNVDFASHPEAEWAMKFIFILSLLLLNLLGIESVGHGSLVFMSCLLTPFIFITCVALTGSISGTTVLGWPFAISAMLGTLPGSPDWSSFLMVLMWNMGSFESVSVCAGEVSNAASVFPRAIAITVGVVLANYILPILAFSGLDGRDAATRAGRQQQCAFNLKTGP
eukprot:CAMPEP_0179467116 /NCGR_PEP_ID=MMETSP0799-20121207/48316_1 /TAXON_ID=46947 /ORGANISM="Geminigera cryophila, Strain CCMP2564" /LENGTH=272 /DNA_ID=CAMNT_0021272345 /DNA_START=6 /DNA_END=821 /DNA_ORIENTATION=-